MAHGAQASLAGNEFVAAVHAAHHQRLHQSILADGVRQLLNLLLIKMTPGLERGRRDVVHFHHQSSVSFLSLTRRGGCLYLGDECLESFT